MLCKGFYEEDVHEIMLWTFFGTTTNIMLCKIMLWVYHVRRDLAVLRHNRFSEYALSLNLYKMYYVR